MTRARIAFGGAPASESTLPLVLAVAAAGAAGGALAAREPLLGLAAVAALALAVAALASPDVASGMVVFVVFTNAAAVAVRFHGAPYAIGALVPLLLVVPVAYHLFRRDRLVLTPALGFIVAFLVLQMLSTTNSVDKGLATQNLTTFAVEGLVLYLLVTNAVRTPEALRLTIWALLAAGALLGALSLLQDLTGTYARPYGGFAQIPSDFFTGHSAEARAAGSIGDPNYYAQALLMVVPLGLVGTLGERSRALRLTALGLTGLAFAGIVLTFSRGAGLAFIVVLTVMAGLRYVRPSRGLGIVLALVVLLVSVPEYRARVSTLGSLGEATSTESQRGADISVRSRTTEMLAAALVYADHPIVGVGPGVFTLYYQEYASRVGLETHDTVRSGPRRGAAPRRESHNMFLSIAADLGTLGLLCFTGIILVTLRDLLRIRRRWLHARPDVAHMATAFFLAILAYVTAGLFLTLAFERYFWLLMALAGAAGALAVRDDPERAPQRTARRTEMASAKNVATRSS